MAKKRSDGIFIKILAIIAACSAFLAYAEPKLKNRAVVCDDSVSDAREVSLDTDHPESDLDTEEDDSSDADCEQLIPVDSIFYTESAPAVPDTLPLADVLIRNDAGCDIPALNAQLPAFGGDGPLVLIVHTHSSEAYTPDEEYFYVEDDTDRTQDTDYNVVRLGNEMAQMLNDAGIWTLHERGINDYPSYNGCYDRMLHTIEGYLEEYPSIQCVIDVHRDAAFYDDGTEFGPTVDVLGTTASQVMIVVGTDQGGLEHPNWNQNLTFAAKIQSQAETLFPGLMRSIDLRAARFNEHETPRSILVEVGATGNTLGQALYGAQLFTKALINEFQDEMQ